MKSKRNLIAVIAFLFVLVGSFCFGTEAKAADANTVEKVMNVKCQVTAGTDENTTEAVNMRLVTSVDSLDYKEVGFEIYYNGATEPIIAKSHTVYERIVASETSGVDYNYNPKVISTDSEYFVTVTLVDIARTNFDKTFYIKPYCKTVENETIYGVSRYVKVSDSYNDIVNLQVKSTAAQANGMQVEYDTEKMTQLTGYDHDGTYAHLVFQVNDGETLSSVTSFVAKDAENNAVDKVLYRNLTTKYTGEGTADRSWYDTNTTATEFMIATTADLYGLVEVAKTYNFSNRTIYLGADITVNEGDATTWSGTNAPTYKWTTSIGDNSTLYFGGTFDGQGDTISGLYMYTDKKAVGLFGHTNVNAVIKNLRLENSYFESTYYAVQDYVAIGSIVGMSDKLVLDSVYSNATVVGACDDVGGLAGRVNNASAGHSVTNCWFDGNVTSTAQRVGGIVGCFVQGNATLDNCLYTGNITSTYTAGAVGVGGLVGYVMNSYTLTATNCLSEGTINTAHIYGIGTILGAGSVKADFTNVYSTNDVVPPSGKTVTYHTLGTAFGNGATVTLLNENMTGVTDTDITGAKAFNLKFDYINTWVANSSSHPELTQFATENAMPCDTSWYEEASATKEYTITTVAELYGLAYLSQSNTLEGWTFKLGNDITVNSGDADTWGTNAPKYMWLTIGQADCAFNGIFDGQGHTIKGVYLKTDKTHVGLFGRVDTSAQIKNLLLVNSYIESTTTSDDARVGGIVGYATRAVLDSIYSDATVVCPSGINVAGIVGRANGNLAHSMTNCWFDGTVYGYIQLGGMVGNVVQGSMTMTNCLNTGTMISDYTGGGVHLAAFVGRGMNSAQFTFTNCLNAGTIDVDHAVYVGSYVGGLTSAGQKATFNNSYSIEKYVKPDSITISKKVAGIGNESTGVTVGTLNVIPEKYLQGYWGYQMTGFDFTNTWVAKEDGTPELEKFSTGESLPITSDLIVADTSWYDDTSATTYTLADKADFYGLMKLSLTANSFAGKTIQISDDMELNPGWKISDGVPKNQWIPIGQYTTFAGKFDGQGHVISGVYVDSDNSYVGLFGFIDSNDRSMNLGKFVLRDSYFNSSKSSTGAVAGFAGTDIYDIYVEDTVKVTTSGDMSGGIVGHFGSTRERSITNCWFAGTIESSYPDVRQNCGGIVGRINMGTKTISNCINTGKVIGNFAATSGIICVGGIIGRVENTGDYLAVVNIESCLVAAEIRVNHQFGAGSVAGNLSSGTVTIKDTYTTNDIWNTTGNKVPDQQATGVGNGSGATFNTDGVYIVTENDLLGVNGYTNTNLGFYIKGQAESNSDVWVARANDVPTIKTFVPEAERLNLANITRPIFIGYADTSWAGAGTQADPYLISTPEELYGLAEVSATNNFSGQYIKLANDIVINIGDAKDYATTAPRNTWKQISASLDFAGTFDGAGYTISGLYLVSSGQYVGLFGRTALGSTVKNVRLENSYFNCTNTDYALSGSIAGKGNGNFDTIYSNAIVVGSGDNIGGIVGWVENSGAHNITNCWFDGTLTSSGMQIGGILGHADNGTITMRNCLNTGSITSTIAMSATGDMGAYAGGLIGRLTGNATTILDSCLSVGEVKTNSTARSAMIIGCSRANNLTFRHVYGSNNLINMNGASINFAGGVSPLVGTYSNNGGPVWTGTPIVKADADMQGANAYRNLGFDFWITEGDEGAWVTVKDEYPVLKSFVDKAEWNKDVDLNIVQINTEWYTQNTSATTFTIRTAADLYGLSELVNAGNKFSGKTIKIASDVDSIIFNEGRTGANRFNWTSIGNADSAFYGTFDGNGKTISGLYQTTASTNGGFFGNVSGVIKNFRLTDSYFETSKYFLGSVVGFLAGEMTNVYSNADVVITAAGAYENGGLVGRFGSTSTKTISNCWFDGTISGDGSHIGGIVGSVNMGNKTISNCLNTGTINNTWTGDAYPHIGGIVGSVWYTKPNASTVATTLNLVDCMNTGKVTAVGTSTVGAIVGRYANNGGGLTYGTVSNVYYTPESYSLAVSTNSQGDITGTTTNIADSMFIQLEEQHVTGANVVAWTTLDFENVWAARAGKVPAIRALLGTEAALDTSDVIPADTSWYDASATTYTLTDEGDLRGFALMANLTNFYNKTVVVDGEITLDRNIQWIPIGNRLYFRGTFGGASASEIATISGVNVKTDKPYVGLFAYTYDGSKIQNLKLIDSHFECTKAGYGISVYLGSIVGFHRGDMENVYSNATVIGHGNDIGGLVGRVQNTQVDSSLGNVFTNMTTRTFTNCWFDGAITSDKQCVGGLVANLVQGGIVFTDCLYTGTMTLSFKDITVDEVAYEVTRAGGILGYAQNSWTKVTMDGVISAGVINNTTGNIGVGTLIGRSTSNEGVYLTNVYAIPGLLYGTNSTTINGTVTEVQPDDRLIGYIDYLNGSGLDFDSTWTLRKSGAPAPKVLVPAEDVYIYEDSALALAGWGSTNASLKNAKDMGVSNYVMTLSDTTDYYKTYESSLVSAGFTKAIDNATDTKALASKGVYNAVYTKADGGVNWVVNVTHAGNSKNESYISVNTGKTAAQALSPHMTKNNNVTYSADDGYTTSGQDVKVVMRQMYDWGNSFIIQLPNGHFIISDGGSREDMKYFIDDLYAMTGGKKPIIEAWTISHLHMDHSNIFHGFWENQDWADKIYVEAIYVNEPGAETLLVEPGISTLTEKERKGIQLLRSTTGELPKMYRYQTGQRFYFNGVTIDVVQAQEQLLPSLYADFTLVEANGTEHGKFNCTSTGLMFTIADGTTNGKKLYIGGDQTKINMDWMMASYNASLFTDVNVFTALHHGGNTMESFTNWSTGNGSHKFDVVLITLGFPQQQSLSLVNDHAVSYFVNGNGNVTLTFTNSGIKSSVADPITWKYHETTE